MQIIVHDGHNTIHNLTFEDSRVTIGSHTDCAVYLPDMRVALQHVALVPIPGGGWLLDPLDLGYKTIHNGRVVTGRTELNHGDEILVSDFLLKLFFEYQTDVEIVKTATMEEVAKIRQYPLPAGSLIGNPHDPFTLPPGTETELARFAFELQKCTDLSKLMETTLRTLVKTFGARMAWMGGRRQDYGRLEFVEGRTPEGPTTAEPPDLETYTYRCLERTQFIVVPRTTHDLTQSALAVPLVCGRGRLGVLYVDSPPDSPVFDLGSLDLLAMYAAMVAVQLEAMVREQIHLQEAIAAGELSFMREIQARLDPTSVPQWEQLQFAVYCKPGLDRSGDVYDVMRMPNGLATFFVAHIDASPRRMALALVEMRAAFRVAALHGDPPHIVLREVNWLLHDPKDPAQAGCSVIVTNPKTGAAECAIAGTTGAIIVGATGEPRMLGESPTPALGENKNFPYTSKSVRIMPDETVVLYTPGSHTICDQRGHPLGSLRLAEALCDGFGISASDALDNLLADLGDYFRRGRQPDDITLVFMHRV